MGLRRQLDRVLEENDRLRRDFVTSRLRVLGIPEESPAGRTALDDYSPFLEPGGRIDRSTLRLRQWLTIEMGTVV